MLFMALMWAQLFLACTYAWRFGEYYDYGWFVPPLFALCVYRLQKEWDRPLLRGPGPVLVLVGGVGLLALLTVLRVFEYAGPGWTLPIWAHGAAVGALGFGVVFLLGGFRAVVRSVPVWVFAFTALPLPTVAEKAFIGHLTDLVVVSASKLLAVLGFTVIEIGDQLMVNGEMVHVTEGCSGIRSAQSFLMVSLFFGEWLRLRPAGRVGMVLVGFVTAWMFNSFRATGLSIVRVEGGQAAFEEWHDTLGYIASIGGAAVLYLVALAIDHAGGRRRRIRSIRMEGRPA